MYREKVLLTTMNSIAVDKNNKLTIPFLSTDSQFYLANANGIKQERILIRDHSKSKNLLNMINLSVDHVSF